MENDGFVDKSFYFKLEVKNAEGLLAYQDHYSKIVPSFSQEEYTLTFTVHAFEFLGKDYTLELHQANYPISLKQNQNPPILKVKFD